jgi:hydroxymethylglutaryl-CoA lyase
MADAVKIVECPRDAWQALPGHIPADAKADYLRRLIAAGFTHIDAASFVSLAAVPQMADSAHVLKLLDPPDEVEIIGIVVNKKGAQRAIATGVVRTLGFPYSVSPGFLERNQHQTPRQSLEELDAIIALARDAGLNIVVYISMAFGNPYGDAWSIDEVVTACGLLVERGVEQISLADTVGLALPERVGGTVAAAYHAQPEVEIGVHLHARRMEVSERIRAAFEAGCRRFDAAIGGLGGCPFAQDDLVGNIPTEVLVDVLSQCGAVLPRLGSLQELIHVNQEIVGSYGAVMR